MNKLVNILSILGLIVISFNTIQAQTLESDSSLLSGNEFKFPPLEVVIDSILKRSAMMNFRKQRIGVREADVKSFQREWTENFGFVADTRYGTFDNFSTNITEINSSSTSSLSQQLNYTVGLFLKIPVFDVINRKNKIKLASLQVDEAKSMADFEKEQLRKTAIRLYQDLILKQKILQIRSRRLGDGRVNMQMVEKEFRNGLVPIYEYVRVTGLTTDIETDYETALSEFIITKQLLEDMAGFVFGLTLTN